MVNWRVENRTDRVLYYDSTDHGLIIPPDPSPPWPETQSRINTPVAEELACLVIVMLLPDRLTVKYEGRRGRFALPEAGTAMQQLSLMVAGLGLAGAVVGGLIDDRWLARLDPIQTGAVVVFGYLMDHRGYG